MIILGLIAKLSDLGVGEFGILLLVPTLFAGIAAAGDILLPGYYTGVIIILAIAGIELASLMYGEHVSKDPKASAFYEVVPIYLITTLISYAVLHTAISIVKERKNNG
ncbi:MAG: hypothetical protein EKK41_16780 [Hyphomicrobiales bacterium]|nr:MAG: hypothetical protein EKK41_16780 [Hyphomicrobiales bacterium]